MRNLQYIQSLEMTSSSSSMKLPTGSWKEQHRTHKMLKANFKTMVHSENATKPGKLIADS